jgi:hypothetical protein
MNTTRPVRPIVALFLLFFIFESYRVSTIITPILRRQQIFRDQIEQDGGAVMLNQKINDDDDQTKKDAIETVPPSSYKGHQEISSTVKAEINHKWTELEDEKINYVAQLLGIPSAEAQSRIHSIWKHGEWNSFKWIRNPDVLKQMATRQEEFLRNPSEYLPKPVVYRPILPGMGWGNLLYDISHHVIFAAMLGRPLLMMLDKKDATGQLGWRADLPTSPEGSVFHPRLMDWRLFGKPELMSLFKPEQMADRDDITRSVRVSCRQGYLFHTQCGGDQHKGNLESLLPVFKSMPHAVLYSEYSASFLMPLRNAKSFKEWIDQNLISDAKRMSTTAAQLRFAFNVAFQTNATFRRDYILPMLARLSEQFTTPFLTMHIRTGHLETGVARDQTMEQDIQALRECQASFTRKEKWLFLTDNAGLSQKISENGTSLTVINTLKQEEEFTLSKFHVGYMPAQSLAWRLSLKDWLLLVESPGPIYLRSRMHSAFSFGQRGALIAGLQCTAQRSPDDVLTQCGNKFFDEVCR